MTRNSTVIMPMDIHKQAIEKKYRQVEFQRQAIRTKAMRSALRLCFHAIDRTFIYTKLPLIVDLTDIKSSIVLKFNW